MISSTSQRLVAIIAGIASLGVMPYSVWRVFDVFSFIWNILVNIGSEEDIIELLIKMFLTVILVIASVKLYKFTRIAW